MTLCGRQIYLPAMWAGSIIGASVSEPLPSDVNVNFVCLSWTAQRMAWQWRMRLIFLDRPAYSMATAHASHFFARGSVCYYGYSFSLEHR